MQKEKRRQKVTSFSCREKNVFPVCPRWELELTASAEQRNIDTADRAEFELPNIGLLGNHVTVATPDCIYWGEREGNVSCSISFAASHERPSKVINFTFQSSVGALEEPLWWKGFLFPPSTELITKWLSAREWTSQKSMAACRKVLKLWHFPFVVIMFHICPVRRPWHPRKKDPECCTGGPGDSLTQWFSVCFSGEKPIEYETR